MGEQGITSSAVCRAMLGSGGFSQPNLGCRSRCHPGKVFVLGRQHRCSDAVTVCHCGPQPGWLRKERFRNRLAQSALFQENSSGGGQYSMEKAPLCLHTAPWGCWPGLALQLASPTVVFWGANSGLCFLTESRNSSNDRMVCREIRRNSAGCLRMRDECEKCREILSVGELVPMGLGAIRLMWWGEDGWR